MDYKSVAKFLFETYRQCPLVGDQAESAAIGRKFLADVANGELIVQPKSKPEAPAA